VAVVPAGTAWSLDRFPTLPLPVQWPTTPGIFNAEAKVLKEYNVNIAITSKESHVPEKDNDIIDDYPGL
jgi:hypothetical protein